MDESLKKTHERLREIRTRNDLSLRPNPLLKDQIVGLDGELRPFKLRYYQVQGVLHLLAMNRFVLGDDTGLGKTAISIGALCYLWEKAPRTKAIILTTKSATEQWAGEFAKFTNGVRVIVCKGSPTQRLKAREAFARAADDVPTVIIMGYRSAVVDFADLQDLEGFVLVADEATAFKSPTTQVHKVVRHLAFKASRIWGLTATLIKNNLIEGYGIYKVVVPDLFGSLNAFMTDYCKIVMIRMGRRQIPKIVGYRPQDIERFRQEIDPFFLGRPKFEVASELPVLSTKTIKVEMSKAQQAKYKEALDGVLRVKEASEEGAEDKEVTKLTAVTYCQQIVNHLGLIGCDGGSEKMDELMDLLSEGDLADEKIIVFTRFRGMVDILAPAVKAAGIESVRVTGSEDEAQRKAAMTAFQDPKSKVRVIFITMAGSDAINLQAAKALVFYDTPWSAGDYLQILGRMIRIGSIHDRVYAVHLAAKGSIDERVIEVMQKKMTLVEKVIGKRIKGEAEAGIDISVENDLSEIFAALKKDAKEAAKEAKS